METDDCILIALSCLLILASIAALLLDCSGKLKPKLDSHTLTGCFIGFYLLIIMDCLLICLSINTFHVTYSRYKNDMTNRINDVGLIIKNAETNLINIANLELRTDERTITEIDMIVKKIERGSGIDSLFQRVNEFHLLIDQTMDNIQDFQIFMAQLANVLSSDCGEDFLPKEYNIVEEMLNIKLGNQLFLGIINRAKLEIRDLKRRLLLEVYTQKRAIMDKSRVSRLLNSMKSILMRFNEDVEKSEVTKTSWLVKMVDVYPDKELIIKNVIRMCTLFFTFTGCISLCSFCRCFDDLSALGMRIAIHLSSYCSIFLSIFVIILSFDVIRMAQCPLASDNFGILNFTTPFMDYDNKIMICSTPPPNTFFSLISRDNSSTFERIGDSFKLDEFAKKLMKVCQSSVISIEYPSNLLDKLNVLKNVSYKLDKLKGLECVSTNDKEALSNHQNTLKLITDLSNLLHISVDKFNKQVGSVENDLESAFDRSFLFTLSSLETSLVEYKIKVSKFDIPCSTLQKPFDDIGASICAETNLPTSEYSLHLLLLMAGALASITCQFLGYRRFHGEILKWAEQQKVESGQERGIWKGYQQEG